MSTSPASAMASVHCVLPPSNRSKLSFLSSGEHNNAVHVVVVKSCCSAVLQPFTVQFTVKNRFLAVQLQKQL